MNAKPLLEVDVAWGLHGVELLRETSDVLVIVDVLSFSSAVEVAVSRGAVVLPYRWRDEMAAVYATDHDAELAGHRGQARWSLSPSVLSEIPAGTRLVLPSPNGATLSRATGGMPTLAGCLRNATACARAAAARGERIGVVAAGERVRLTGADGTARGETVRPALEDLLGAGAIVDALSAVRTPEAQTAAEAFEAARSSLRFRLEGCRSGLELIDRGWPDDVRLAAEHDVSQVVPSLQGETYRT